MRQLSQSCFFFTIRRRHTRCLSDCSSDVCSSDLSLSSVTSLVRPSQRDFDLIPRGSVRDPLECDSLPMHKSDLRRELHAQRIDDTISHSTKGANLIGLVR